MNPNLNWTRIRLVLLFFEYVEFCMYFTWKVWKSQHR